MEGSRLFSHRRVIPEGPQQRGWGPGDLELSDTESKAACGKERGKGGRSFASRVKSSDREGRLAL